MAATPDAPLIEATVVVATAGRQATASVLLPAGSSLLDAVRASGLVADLSAPLDLGVFNRPRPPTDLLRAGDRIEIYRPLVIDPKKARRARAEVRRQRRG